MNLPEASPTDSTCSNYSQNRFYDATGYDVDIRKWCKENGVIYQSFWTLTASQYSSTLYALRILATDGRSPDPHTLKHKAVIGPVKRLSLTPEQVFYQFCIQEGIMPLNGTTDPEHMKLGVEVLQNKVGELTENEMQAIRSKLY